MATRFADGFNPAEGIVRVVTAERPLMKNLKRTVIAVVTSMSSIVLSVGAISVGASAAHASTGISGQVQCVDELAVEGVWIQASSGGSGFASLQNLNGYTKNFRYSLPHGGAWTVHVGLAI